MNERKYNVVKVLKEGIRKDYHTYYGVDVLLSDSFKIIKENVLLKEAQRVCEKKNKKLETNYNIFKINILIQWNGLMNRMKCYMIMV